MNLKIKDYDITFWKDSENNISEITIYHDDELAFEWNKESNFDYKDGIEACFVPHMSMKILNALYNGSENFLTKDVEFSDAYKLKILKIKKIISSNNSEKEKLNAINKIIEKVS